DGAHDGYAPSLHRRRVLAVHGSLLAVADFIGGTTEAARTAAVHWHFAPGWTADLRGSAVALRSRDDIVTLVARAGRIDLFTADEEIGLGWCSPVYGRVEPCTTVRISGDGRSPFWLLSVFDLDPNDPIASVELMPVWAEAGAIAHAAAARITRASSTSYLLFAEPAPAAHAGTWRVAEFETDTRTFLGRLSPDADFIAI